MKLFSVPADFRTSTIDRLAELNARHEDAAVTETYGTVTWGGFCGRAVPSPGYQRLTSDSSRGTSPTPLPGA